jgi:hypothetical protein
MPLHHIFWSPQGSTLVLESFGQPVFEDDLKRQPLLWSGVSLLSLTRPQCPLPIIKISFFLHDCWSNRKFLT